MKEMILSSLILIMTGCQTSQVSSNYIERSWLGHNIKELNSNKELNSYKRQESFTSDDSRVISYSYEFKKVTNSLECVNTTDPLTQRAFDPTMPDVNPCQPNSQVNSICMYQFSVQNDIITSYKEIGDQCPSSCKVSYSGCN